jgi:SET domain-containing protein
MNRKQLLKNLKNETYCRLKQSPIHGVGVFAIRDIPKGMDPFKGRKRDRGYAFAEKELKNVHSEVKKMIHDLCVSEKQKIWIPDFGLNSIGISYFCNSSQKPNLKALKEGEKFITIREIKAGEELTVDYDTFDENSE